MSEPVHTFTFRATRTLFANAGRRDFFWRTVIRLLVLVGIQGAYFALLKMRGHPIDPFLVAVFMIVNIGFLIAAWFRFRKVIDLLEGVWREQTDDFEATYEFDDDGFTIVGKGGKPLKGSSGSPSGAPAASPASHCRMVC